MLHVSGCARGDGVQSQRLRSSRELQRICAVVFGRFYGGHRIKDAEVGVEGVARSVTSAILSTTAALFRPDIADPRILSWWTETDLRTDSLHQSDAPLGLTWYS